MANLKLKPSLFTPHPRKHDDSENLTMSLLSHTHIKAGFRLTCRLPHCRYAAWSSLAVSELQLSAATPLWLYHRAASLPSCIEFNCLRSAAVGKAARLSIYWLDAACRLVIPLRQVALAQLNKYHHQSGNAASGKLVWNQHKTQANTCNFHSTHSFICNKKYLYFKQ